MSDFVIRGQCGGNGWSGPTCCATGSVCTVGNPWYSQCLPGTAPPPPVSSTTSRATSSSAAPPPPSSTSRATSVVPTTSRATSAVPTTSAGAVTSTSAGPAPTGGATYSGNPFLGVNQWANAYYRSEVLSIAVPSLTGAMAAAAAKVADVPTFQWMDTRAKVPLVDTALGEIRAANARGGNYAGIFVVYNLPDRDCAAKASNGELAIADDGVNKYKAYIDSIRAVLLKYSDIRTILVIEPDSLANMVTNMNVPKVSSPWDPMSAAQS
jgi:cellulose 1,4-beta-cellobiosidase